TRDTALRGGQVLLERTLVLLLLRHGLEGTVSKLGRGIDPLEVDLLQSLPRGVGEHGLAQSHDTLLDTRDRALEHDEVVVDLAIADEATETNCKLERGTEISKSGETYGVMVFLVMSISVEALSSASPLPIL